MKDETGRHKQVLLCLILQPSAFILFFKRPVNHGRTPFARGRFGVSLPACSGAHFSFFLRSSYSRMYFSGSSRKASRQPLQQT